MKNLSSYNQDLSIPRKKDLDALETKIDGKQDAITGGASTITTSNLTANRALISSDSGKVTVSTITSTKLGYLSGVHSDIQTQIDEQYDHTAEKASYIFTSGTLGNNNITMSENGLTQLLEVLDRWKPYDDYDGYGKSDYMEPVLVCEDYNNTTAYLKFASTDDNNWTFSGIYMNNAKCYQGIVLINNLGVEYSNRIEIVQSELPTVSTVDNGKFLRVVNGAWAADTVPSAGGVAF